MNFKLFFEKTYDNNGKNMMYDIIYIANCICVVIIFKGLYINI